MSWEATSREELHDQIEVDVVLEGEVHRDDPLAILRYRRENVTFRSGVRSLKDIRSFRRLALFRCAYLFLLKHIGFAQNFHRVDMTRVHFLHEANLKPGVSSVHLRSNYLSESASSDDLQRMEVRNRQLCAAKSEEVGLLGCVDLAPLVFLGFRQS